MKFSEIPFLRLSKIMVVELVYQQVFWFNYTVPENYISAVLGPGAIIIGIP